MATLEIAGQAVEVSDNFLKLSPDEQNAAVDEIAASMGIKGDAGAEPAPELTGGRAAGLGGRVGVEGAVDAVLGTPALVGDYLRGRVYEPVNTVRRLLGREEIPWEGLSLTNKADKVATGAADALGLPQPVTDEEKLAVATGRSAVGALLPAGAARAAARAATGVGRRVLGALGEGAATQGFVGGAAGGGAELAAQNDVNPLVGAGLGLAGGIGTSVGVNAARAGVRAGRQAVDRALARGADVQQQLAAERFRGAASDPNAAVAAIDGGGADELVPGSKPTTFQATGDMGLGALERQFQTENPGRFADRRADQNTARTVALQNLQERGDPDTVVHFLKSELDDIERSAASNIDAGRNRAQDLAGQIGGTGAAEDYGRAMRDPLARAEQAARARESSLWDAVDPDGSLTVSMQGIRESVNQIYDKLARSERLGLTQAEKDLADTVRSYGAVEPFREVVGLRSQLSAALMAELRANGRTPAYGRLARLRGDLESGIMRAARQRAAAEFDAINGGALSPQETIAARLKQLSDEHQAATGRNAGADYSRQQAVAGGARRLSGMAGEAAPGNGGSGSLPRVQGLQGSAQRQGRPLSLTQFIAKNGGLALDGDAAAADFGNRSVPGYGKLARPNGRSIDGYWRNKLIDEGYLPPDSDGYSSRDITRELFRRIEEERAGRKSYSIHDENRIPAGGGEEGDLRAAASQIRDELRSAGLSERQIDPRMVDEAAYRLARGEERDAITAYERAVMDAEEPGPRASAPMREPGPSPRLPNSFDVDAEGYRRLRAASDATKERAKTYNQGNVGPLLRKASDSKTFRMTDANVGANVFRPGPSGAERVRDFLKAVGNDPEALDALHDYAALSLRKAALTDEGTIDPKKFARWRSLHADALRELPAELKARFSDAANATRAMQDMAAARKAEVDSFRKSVLGKLAGTDPEDLPRVIGNVLNARDSAKQVGHLVARVSKNPDAKEGLRKAVAEYIEGRFISNKEVGTSGDNAIRAEAFATFIRDKKPALTMVFGSDHVRTLEAIAADIKRSERSLHAIKIPGNSNSPQDLAPVLDKLAKESGGGSLFTQIVLAAFGGFSVGGPKGAAVGAAGAVAKNVLGNMRAAGMQRVDDLVLEMLLDPQLAKTALLRAGKPAEKVLSNRLLRLPIYAAPPVGGAANRDREAA